MANLTDLPNIGSHAAGQLAKVGDKVRVGAQPQERLCDGPRDGEPVARARGAAKLDAIMRPSATFNAALGALA